MKRFCSSMSLVAMVLGVVVGCTRDRWGICPGGGCPGGVCGAPPSVVNSAPNRSYAETYVPPSSSGPSSFGAGIGGGAGS